MQGQLPKGIDVAFARENKVYTVLRVHTVPQRAVTIKVAQRPFGWLMSESFRGGTTRPRCGALSLDLIQCLPVVRRPAIANLM